MHSARDDATEKNEDSAAAQGGASSIRAQALPVLLRHEHCLREGGVPCRKCEEACPHGAVSFGEGPRSLPRIDARLCTGCCACSGVCDAFSPAEATMEDVAARALRAAGKADPVYVVCDPLFPEGEKPAANTVVVPCLAACCPEFWTSLLTAGTEVSAVCDFDECASCAIAGEAAVDSYAASIETAQRWTGSSVRMAESAPVQTSLAREYGRNDASERRDVLKKIALDVTEAANGTRRAKTSSVLQDFHARQERLRLTVRQSTSGDKALSSLQPDGGKKKIRTPRRTMLFRAARTARGALDALEVPVSVTDEDACTGEAECVEACPRGARSVHGGSASVDPEVCVGCGMCAKACPRAAAATKAVPLGRLLANAAQTRQDGADGPFVNG